MKTLTPIKIWTIRTRDISSGEYFEATFYEMSEADAKHHALGDNPGSEVVGAWPYALHEIDEDADRDDELAGFAASMCQVPTLTERGNDSLDFHDVSVWGLRDALRAAYAAGRESICQGP